MSNQTTNNLTQQHEAAGLKGDITYSDRVIEKIIGKSLETVPGLLSVSGGFLTDFKNKIINSDDVTEGVNVEVGTKQVATDLRIVVEYGRDIPEIVDTIKLIISEEVTRMTHLEVIEVNVHVVDIKTRGEFEKESITIQDRVTEAGKATTDFVSEQAAKAGEVLGQTAEQVRGVVEESRVQ
ncbi:Asp23/Gls24 family envelope stress response protein [Streptococcus ruminantium]|uniref:Asp23/Gls24 family envelope stress response protein n=1 Tax=Streptococcus ruminantium TaxID=1917441 RepID=UPI0012DF0B71|nr:Asp23/Gls24 family envelope stress response protein [Streptococcus ruminantium]